MDKNIQVFENNGQIETNDSLLNRVIRQAEKEVGGQLAMAIPAVTFDEDPDKSYLILLNFYEGDKDWVIKQGRQEAYDFIRLLIKEEEIDPNQSFIISCKSDIDDRGKEDIKPITKPITLFRFMKVMIENGKVLDDKTDFDITEYDPGDYENGDKTIVEV